MLGFKFIKFDSMTYVIHYKNGKIKKEGRGLSFFYYAPSASIVAIPFGSNDIPFIFNETTSDFQTISIQGQITYKVENPKELAEVLDFTVDSAGVYKTDDAEKLSQRLINQAQTATSSFIQNMELKKTLRSAKAIETTIIEGLQQSDAVKALGVKALSVNVTSVKASPEMARALETTTREALQQEADEAIYQRRNFAVEQEKKIKESELDTEIAVEEKKKQISEKKMQAKLLMQKRTQELREQQLESDIEFEARNSELITQKVENQKKEADVNEYVLQARLRPYREMDWKTLMAMSNSGNLASASIAEAFGEMAANAQKIENLNISPELLQSLTQQNQSY